MSTGASDYTNYLHGGLLHNRYLRVKGLNEGSFGIVSIAKDTKNNDKLVAVKYNTGILSDFQAYQQKTKKGETTKDNLDIRSISLDSKTTSLLKPNQTYSHTENSDKDISKSIVLRETKQEILMLKKVDSHPNITTLIDYFDTFMVMEYVPRGDLHDAIQLGIAPVATRDVIDVFMQLISAVEYCHKNGVYHRDIKPENILIAEDWSIKLTDFGLATDLLICDDFDVGSERYMAPELLEHSDIETYAADKVDIWSLGIVLLNIVFGKSPFKSASSKDKMFLYFAANRETLFDIFPFMSYDLFSVMINSLALDPANRDLEMIKRSLLSVDVLTYDNEFVEEAEDLKEIPLVEEPSEADQAAEDFAATQTYDEVSSFDSKDTGVNGKLNTHDISSGDKQKAALSKVESTSTQASSQSSSSSHSSNSSHIESTKCSVSPNPTIIIKSDSETMQSIDDLVESEKDTTEDFPKIKPISINKKYEPPHKLLSSTSLSKYMQEIKKCTRQSNNKNREYRHKRFNGGNRKPLRVAGQSNGIKLQDTSRAYIYENFKDDSLDFNRKDFFTPRSAFTSYMEKANKGKLQWQQKGHHYRSSYLQNGNHNKNSRYNYNNYNYYNGNNNHGHNRRAWKKRKRRESHLNTANNYIGNFKNYRGSFHKANNYHSKNSRKEWYDRHEGSNSNKQGRRYSSTLTDLVRLSSSMRSSIDGKYVPPNMRLTQEQLTGSAIFSDDEEDEEEDDYLTDNIKYDGKRNNDSPDAINSNDSDEDDFTFEFEQAETYSKNRGQPTSEPTLKSDLYNQVQSTAMNLLNKQFSEYRIFDDKHSPLSRDGSNATTVSYNQSSAGSNINDTITKGYRKYVPPHQRRSSHSGTDSIEHKVKFNLGTNNFMDKLNNNFSGSVSSSAPTKSSSFFMHNYQQPAPPDSSSLQKMFEPHELLLDEGAGHKDKDEQLDDLFEIEER